MHVANDGRKLVLSPRARIRWRDGTMVISSEGNENEVETDDFAVATLVAFFGTAKEADQVLDVLPAVPRNELEQVMAALVEAEVLQPASKDSRPSPSHGFATNLGGLLRCADFVMADRIRQSDCYDFGTLGGLMSAREMAVIADLLWLARPQHILEVGHYCGFSSLCLAETVVSMAKRRPGYEPVLTTVDWHQDDSVVRAHWRGRSSREVFFDNLEKSAAASQLHKAGRLHVVIDSFDAFLKSTDETWGFVFYDAEHAYDVQRQFIDLIADRLLVGGVLVLDDIDLWGGPQIDQDLSEDARFLKLATPLLRYNDDKMNRLTFTEGVYLRV